MTHQTLVETSVFTRKAAALLTTTEHDDLCLLLAANPTAGVIIPGTGGIRKLRVPIQAQGKGKSGGARVIYYFHDDTIPLVLLSIYAKNEKVDLTQDEKKTLRNYAAEYVAAFR